MVGVTIMQAAIRIALMLAAFPTLAAASDWHHYGNARFQYGIDIPPGFSSVAESDNGDGGVSRSSDGRAELAVWGSYLADRGFSAEAQRRITQAGDDGWTITLKGIAADSPKEGIDAVRAAVVELEDAGYLVRHVVQGQGGRFLGDDWELRDPHDLGAATLPALDYPTRRKRTALDNPTRTALDNPTPIRTPVRRSRKSSKGDPKSGQHFGIGGRVCTAELIDDRHCALGHVIDAEAVAS